MRDNIGLNDRQAKFVALVAGGEMSIAQAYREAGFSNSSSNAHKLKKHLAEDIAAEKTRLGIRDDLEASPDIDDDNRAALANFQRKLYADAVASGNLAVQRAALRALERLLKRSKPGGRPTTTAPMATKPGPERMSDEAFQALVAKCYSDEENAAYEVEREAEREIETQRALWIEGKPSRYMELRWGVRANTGDAHAT